MCAHSCTMAASKYYFGFSRYVDSDPDSSPNHASTENQQPIQPTTNLLGFHPNMRALCTDPRRLITPRSSPLQLSVG